MTLPPAASPAPDAAPPQTEVPAATSAPSTAAVRRCERLSTGSAAPGAVRPVSARQATSADIKFDAASNTITVGGGAQLTLSAIADAVAQPAALQRLADGSWLLGANLELERDTTLTIAAPEVPWLKLRSVAGSFVSLKALGGTLEFRETCVTSWDDAAGSVDHTDADGRSFVLARDGAELRIERSELSYLGYDANESYGVALRLEGTHGTLTDSVFGYNFYGIYAFEASDLIIRNNEVHDNVRYGIDPHTRSDRLLIEGNDSHHNGKQGIILAEDCSDSTIRNNVSHDNALHGIVIFQHSNRNVVEGNTTYGNGLQGINVNDSSDNTIQGNTVYENTEAGIGIGQDAQRNLVVGNTVHTNGQDGIYVYSGANDTEIRENSVYDNVRYGIYVKSDGTRITTGNDVTGNSIGIFLNVDNAPDVSTDTNRVYNNREAQIQITPN